MKVFYSWQSDAPRKTNKDFIRSAIDEAIAQLNAEIEVTNANRETSEPIIEIDQDTQGVLGSPPISQIIFEKIINADIILLDVSLVASSSSKKHINSNVAIELGFALGARDYTRLGSGLVLVS